MTCTLGFGPKTRVFTKAICSGAIMLGARDAISEGRLCFPVLRRGNFIQYLYRLRQALTTKCYSSITNKLKIYSVFGVSWIN